MASLSELAKEAPHVKVGPVPPESKAVEDLTREMMKPLLKSWLDSNLPEIIERVVRDEIARLSREARAARPNPPPLAGEGTGGALAAQSRPLKPRRHAR